MISMHDFQRQWHATGPDVLRAVQSVGSEGWYILGRQVRDFEQALASYWGLPRSVGVASGLDAIELSLRALGCAPGDHVLTSPISAFATALAILKLGATPVFADCDSLGMIDLDACNKLLSGRPEIRYFVPVHLYGQSLDLSELRLLRDRYELKMVEDCAQSIGAQWGSARTGTVGQFAATSFYPTKNLGALGDGGAVLTRTDEDAAAIRRLRDYGQSARYRHEVIGYNSRLDELQAAILKDVFLPRLEEWTEIRRQVAERYLNELSSPSITLSRPRGEPCWHLFPVRVEASRKQDFLEYLNRKGILAGEHYPLAIPEQPALGALRPEFGSPCPRARSFCRQEVSLPIHPYLTSDEQSTIIQACNEWR